MAEAVSFPSAEFHVFLVLQSHLRSSQMYAYDMSEKRDTQHDNVSMKRFKNAFNDESRRSVFLDSTRYLYFSL